MSKKRNKRKAKKRFEERMRPCKPLRSAFQENIPPWINNDMLPCPCGSGVTFKDCCKDFIPKEAKTVDNFASDDVAVGERAYRASLTKYLGYVFKHTLPWLQQSNKTSDNFLKKLVKIDVEAIFETVENIAFYLEKQNKSADVIHLCDHLSETVPLPGLNDRMLFLKVIWYDVKL